MKAGAIPLFFRSIPANRVKVSTVVSARRVEFDDSTRRRQLDQKFSMVNKEAVKLSSVFSCLR